MNIFENFFIILLLYLLQAKMIDKIEIIKPNQNFYSQENCLMFQSNESDINKITSTNFTFIQKSFQITPFDNGKLIKQFFFNSIQFQNQLALGICQFFNKNQSYFIICIDGLQLNHNFTSILYLKNYKTIKIEIASQNQTVCTDMIIDQNNQIFSYCQNPNNFQIHKINLKNLTSIMIQNNDLNILNCSQRFFNFNSILYLALYNCENWTIFDVTNNLKIILNNEILSNLITIQPNIKIGFVSQIALCSKHITNYQQEQVLIFLVESNKYYLFDIFQNKILFENFETFQGNIIKLSISENCKINYIVVESKIEDKYNIEFNQSKKEISINKNLRQNVLALKQYLIIQRSSKLQLILSEVLSETYNIMSSEIQVIDGIKDNTEKILIYLPNFLYQINYQENFIQFYEYQDHPRYIKPRLNYIYLFEWFEFFQDLTQAQIIKYTLIYNTPQQVISYMQSNPLKISIQYYCNQIVTFKITKDLSQYLIEIEQQVFITSYSKIISIEEDIAFSKFYQKNEVSEIKKIIWMNNLDISEQAIIAFQSKNNQLKFYCQKQLKQLQFSMNQYEVINHQGFLLIFEKNKNQLITINLIIFLLQQTFTLNDNIVQYKTCIDAVIFLLANDEIVIFNLVLSKFLYLKNQFKQFGQPIFYHYLNLFTIIQYEQFLIILSKSLQYYKYRIDNVTIFNLELNLQFFKIISIHNQKNQLLIYQFDGKQLKLENEYQLQNYQLIRPLIYSGSKEYLALAALKDEQKVILIVNIFQYISILKVISCSDHSFTQIDNFLVYFNNEGILTILNIKEYLITYKIENKLDNYFTQQKETIYIKFQSNHQYYTYLQQIDIEIQNSCYQLSILKNNLKIEDNTMIQTQQLFYGPSESIVSSNLDYFQISHPIRYSYSITDCNKTNSNFCFINFETQELEKYGKFEFQFKCLFNSNYLIDSIPLYCFNQTNYGNLQMFKQFNLLNSSTLISIIQHQNLFYINFFKIDFKQKLFIGINSYKLYQENSLNVFQYDIIYKNQLFLLKQKLNYAQNVLIYVKENQYKFYENLPEIHNIFCINQLEDVYLVISETCDYIRYFISFQKICFDLFNAKIIQSINLHQELLDYIQRNREINSQENLIDPSLFNYQKKFYSCIQDDQNLLVCKLFIIVQQISCDILITINFEQQSFDFELLRLIRNPLNKQNLELYYIDSSIIIITTRDEKSYIYETSLNQTMYDYISVIELLKYLIFQIDTNQYFFVDYEQENFYIGEFGYKINLLNQSNNEKGYLIIKNSISEIKIEVNFQQTNNNTQQKYFIYLLCILLIILLICFYILRRSKLKKIKSQIIMQNIN